MLDEKSGNYPLSAVSPQNNPAAVGSVPNLAAHFQSSWVLLGRCCSSPCPEKYIKATRMATKKMRM
jgi:hypothetical protein